MFWLDAALCSELVLDGIVTVVDAKYGAQVRLLTRVLIIKKDQEPT